MKFSIDVENITVGELEDADGNLSKMCDLMAKFAVDDMGTPISEEAASRMLRAKNLKEIKAIQLHFLADLIQIQTNGTL